MIHRYLKLTLGLLLLLLPHLSLATFSPATSEILGSAEQVLSDIQGKKIPPQPDISSNLPCGENKVMEYRKFIKKELWNENENHAIFKKILQSSDCLNSDTKNLTEFLKRIDETALSLGSSCNQINLSLIDILKELHYSIFVDIKLLQKFGEQDKTTEHHQKAHFIETHYPQILRFRYLSDAYQKKIKRQYSNLGYLPYDARKNPKGCPENSISEVTERIKRLIKNFQEITKIINGGFSLDAFMEEIAKEITQQLSEELQGEALTMIRPEFTSQIGTEQSNNESSIDSQYQNLETRLEDGNIVIGEIKVETSNWINPPKNIDKILQEKKLLTQEDIFRAVEKADYDNKQSKEISILKARFLLQLSEADNQLTSSLENSLRVTDSCVQKSFTEDEKGKNLGCEITANKKGTFIQPSQKEYSLPNFEKRLEEYVNAQCQGMLPPCYKEN